MVRLGAGATVRDVIAQRDGRRIAIFWHELGPATSEVAGEGAVVRGLYCAVLHCDAVGD